MELIKNLPNELKTKIFLYGSYIPFKKNELNHHVNNIKAVYYKSNYNLSYIDKIQFDCIDKELFKLFNNSLYEMCRIGYSSMVHTITDDIYCYMLDNINNTYINKRFLYYCDDNKYKWNKEKKKYYRIVDKYNI